MFGHVCVQIYKNSDKLFRHCRVQRQYIKNSKVCSDFVKLYSKPNAKVKE